MDGYITIGTEINTKDFDKQITYIESKMQDIEDKLKQADMGFEVGDVQKLEAEYEKLGNQLISLKQKQEKYNQSVKEASNGGLQNIEGQLFNIGSKVEDVTKKVGRWALAVFGVRTAFSAVRGAMSTLSQYDEQMSTNLEYMRFVLANAIKPVIETIINLAYTLLTYLNEILKAWFGINLFSKDTTKQFINHVNSTGKQAKNMKSTAKTAKDLQKTMAGFDEMNIIQDNKSSGTGGGSKGAGAGNVTPLKTPKIPDIKIPKWLTYIIKNGPKVIEILAGVVGALAAIKLGFSAIQALGIGIAIAGILFTIESIINFLNDPTFENFTNILIGIAIAVGGVAIAFGLWPVAIGAAVALLILLIVKNFDKIKKLLDGLMKWIDTDFLKILRDWFGPLGDILFIPIKYFVGLAKGAFESFFGGIKKIIGGVMKIFKGDFFGGIKDIFGGLLSVLTAPLQGFLKAAKSIIPNILGLFKKIGTKVGEVIGKAFKGVVNGVLGAIETILNTPIRAINGLIKVINKVPGINLGKLDTFDLPRLAKGGIINQPGRGVAIGGEAGPEAVLPLTDSQQMALLGEAIGRYITITANITNSMNGRVISREIQRINAEQDFAYNR